jgi:ankyrin repeat protein
MINELDLDKHTPLSLAVREEKFFVAKLLLLHGADPRKGGGAFGSSLHMAVTKL